MVCIDVFPQLKQDTFWCSFIHVCFFLFCFFQRKLRGRDDRLTCRLNWVDLSGHIKEPQNGIYCFNFFFKKMWKAETFFFFNNVTFSVLSVCMLSVSSCSTMYFSLRTCVAWECHGLSVIATVTKGGNKQCNKHCVSFYEHYSFVSIRDQGCQVCETKSAQLTFRKELDWRAIWPIIMPNPPFCPTATAGNLTISFTFFFFFFTY